MGLVSICRVNTCPDYVIKLSFIATKKTLVDIGTHLHPLDELKMTKFQTELHGPNARPDFEKHETVPHVILLEYLQPSDLTSIRKTMIEIVRTELEFLFTLTILNLQPILAMGELGFVKSCMSTLKRSSHLPIAVHQRYFCYYIRGMYKLQARIGKMIKM